MSPLSSQARGRSGSKGRSVDVRSPRVAHPLAASPPSPAIKPRIPAHPLLTELLSVDTEADLVAAFTQLKAMLQHDVTAAALSPPPSPPLKPSLRVGAASRAHNIPKKEFVERCRLHRERHLMVWTRDVRQCYQECLQLLAALPSPAKQRPRSSSSSSFASTHQSRRRSKGAGRVIAVV